MGKPTVVICIDGFDPEYLEACNTPNLDHLAQKGFCNIGHCMMPSVTNVNNVSLLTAAYPESHGICSNYWLVRDTKEEVYAESAEYIQTETIFQRSRHQGKNSILVTSKDKLRTLLADGAGITVSSEQAPDWVVQAVGPPPPIYSLEVNGWVIKAANHIMTQQPADLVYMTTTDYAMHTYPPDAPESQSHMSILDEAIGELVTKHPDAALLVTADHGMSNKTRMVDLRSALDSYGIRSNPVPIIKDRYVVHHSNLGGCIYVYLDSIDAKHRDLGEAVKILNDIPGVLEALTREEAAAKFRLSYDRIGDIVVTGEEDVVFGDPSEVQMPVGLRSHGSTHERNIPIIGYNGDFDGFAFEENRDLGRYIFERVLD